MRNNPVRSLIVVLGALFIIVGAVTFYRYTAHRAASKELDGLAAPAPRRDPVSLRPGAQ